MDDPQSSSSSTEISDSSQPHARQTRKKRNKKTRRALKKRTKDDKEHGKTSPTLVLNVSDASLDSEVVSSSSAPRTPSTSKQKTTKKQGRPLQTSFTVFTTSYHTFGIQTNYNNSIITSDMIPKTYHRNSKGFFICDDVDCTYTSEAIDGFKIHLLTHNETNFRCRICECQFFKGEKAWRDHLKNIHQMTGAKASDSIVNDADLGVFKQDQRVFYQQQPFRCDKCIKGYGRRLFVERHIEIDHKGVRYACPGCSQLFTRFENLFAHHSKVHTNRENPDEQVTCVILEQNIDGKFIKPKYPCSFCGKVLSTVAFRDQHLSYCSTLNNNFNCTLCGTSFNSYIYLKVHMQNHSRTIVCKKCLCKKKECTLGDDCPTGVCNRAFGTTAYLNKHQLQSSAHNRPTLQCPECPKKFFVEISLTDHLEKNICTFNKDKVQCSLCTRMISPPHMKTHKDTHERRIQNIAQLTSAQKQKAETTLLLANSLTTSFLGTDHGIVRTYEKDSRFFSIQRIYISRCGDIVTKATKLQHDLGSNCKSFYLGHSCQIVVSAHLAGQMNSILQGAGCPSYVLEIMDNDHMFDPKYSTFIEPFCLGEGATEVEAKKNAHLLGYIIKIYLLHYTTNPYLLNHQIRFPSYPFTSKSTSELNRMLVRQELVPGASFDNIEDHVASKRGGGQNTTTIRGCPPVTFTDGHFRFDYSNWNPSVIRPFDDDEEEDSDVELDDDSYYDCYSEA